LTTQGVSSPRIWGWVYLIHCLSLWILWATGPSIPSLVPTKCSQSNFYLTQFPQQQVLFLIGSMALVIDPSQKSLSCDSYILSQYYLWWPVCPLSFPTHTGNPLPLAYPPTRLVFVFKFLLVRQRIAPDLTIHTLAVPLSQIYLLHQTPFSFFPYALVVLLVSVNVMVSKSLLTLSFSISFSSSTTLFVSFSILFPWSIMIYFYQLLCSQLLQYLSV
jgi:hypothetical protein